MTAFFSQALVVLSRLIFALRSVCSLRRLVVLLPAGKAAPRLNIHWSNGHTRGLWQFHSEDVPSLSDETYTTTTCVTDFDGESGPYNHDRQFNSIPKRCHLLSDELEVRRTKRGTHNVKCQSDHGFGDTYLEWRAPNRRAHSRSSAKVSTRPSACHTTTSNNLPPRVSAQGKRGRHIVRGQRTMKSHGCTQSSTRFFAGLPNDSSKDSFLKSSKPHLGYSDQTSESGRSSSGDSDAKIGLHNLHSSCDARRINQLEMEMFHLRSQLARLLLAQEGKRLLATSSEEFDQRLEGDGESDAGPVDIRDAELSHPTVNMASETSESAPLPIVTPSSTLPRPPPPPPLPPPPPPPSPATQFDWRAQLIAAKKKKYGTDSLASIHGAETAQKAADMGQVLRELQSGAIRLRAVPRSPGGTPVRSHPSPKYSDTDPCSIIARALKSKFGGARAVLNVSSSGGENTQGSSFCESPQVAEVKSSITNRVDIIAPFGQHLLRPAEKANHVPI